MAVEVKYLFQGLGETAVGQGIMTQQDYRETVESLGELARTDQLLKWKYNTHLAMKSHGLAA
jgi:hypothetical protein